VFELSRVGEFNPPVLFEGSVLEYHITYIVTHTVAPPPHDGSKVSTPQLLLDNSNIDIIITNLAIQSTGAVLTKFFLSHDF
jgi:hypothetical protein